MTKFTKRLTAVIMAAAMATSMAVSASAITTPQNFSNFSVAPSNMEWRYLTQKSKDTDTKAYLYISSAQVSTYARICGATSSSVKENCTLDSSGNSVTSIVASVSNAVKINNNVRANYNYATIGLKSSSSYSGMNVSGSWAPDTTEPTV